MTPALRGEVEVRPKVPKTLRGHSSYNEKLNLISVIPLMLRNAVLVQSEESPSGLKSHLLVCKVRFSYDPNKTRYFVALIIREDGNGRLYYEHELTEIKEKENILRGHNPVSSPTSSVLNIIQSVVYSSGFRKNFEKNLFQDATPFGDSRNSVSPEADPVTYDDDGNVIPLS